MKRQTSAKSGPRKDMLTEQMLRPRERSSILNIKVKQRVRIDLSGLALSKTGEPIEAWVDGIVLDNDAFHHLVTVKLDNSVYRPEIVIRVPAERVNPTSKN